MTVARSNVRSCFILEGDPLPPEDHVPSPAPKRLATIYRQHRAGVLRFLSRRTAPDRAEALVQHTFVRLAAFDQDRLGEVWIGVQKDPGSGVIGVEKGSLISVV